MLSKQYRLKKKSAFTATYRIKNSFYKNGIVLFVGKKKCDDSPTVKRNRLKRLMRESYRLLMKENNLGNSNEAISLIFIGQKEALGKSFVEVQSAIKNLLERV